MNPKPTITVGIAAFNAERNIVPMLEAIGRQKQTRARIEKIIVHSDASGDATVEKVRAMKDPRVVVIDLAHRQGFANAVMNICKESMSDLTVLLNDDIQIHDARFIEKLAGPFLRESGVGLVSANPQPFEPRTFLERGVVSTFKAYERMRYALNDGNNEFTCDGKVLALSKEFIQSIVFPSDMGAMGNVDAFLYFTSLSNGFLYRHVRDAVVYFQCPSTVRDYINWTVRNDSDEYILTSQFGEIVKREYKKPVRVFLWAIMREFFKNPAGVAFMFFVGRYAAWRARRTYASSAVLWDVVGSTKNLPNVVDVKTSRMLSVAVGIPAYNEAANIKNLVSRILNQKQEGFTLDEIYVVSDGSTDTTMQEVEAIKSDKVRLLANEVRRGQAHVQNMIFALAQSDVVVIFEADTIPTSENYIATLIAPIAADSGVGLVQGNAVALEGNSLLGRVFKAQSDIYYKVIRRYPVLRDWAISGRGGRAFSAFVYKEMLWPNSVPEDSYAMLWCRSKGIATKFQESAVCNFRRPETFSDLQRECIKVRNGRKALEQYFNSGDISKAYDRPALIRGMMFLEFLLWHPVYALFFTAVKVRMLFAHSEGQFSDFSPITVSTKRH